MNTTYPVSIQIRVHTFVADSYSIPEWAIVSLNQKTVAKVTAKGLGGYGRRVR